MPKYQYKPAKQLQIDAIQWWPGKMLVKEVLDCFGGLKGMGANSLRVHQGQLTIRSKQGDLDVGDGDWIVRGNTGRFFIFKPEDFEMIYERVDDNA